MINKEIIDENARLKQRIRELEISEVELKKVQAALWIAEQKYQTIFETTGTIMIIIDNDMTISLANNGFQALTGYSREEIEGRRKWTDFIHRDDLAGMIAKHQNRRLKPDQTEKNYEFRLVHRDGRIKHILITIDLLPGTQSSIASLIDISDRNNAEEALRESEIKFKSFAEQALAGTYIIQDGIFKYVNPTFARMFGYTVEECLAGMRFENLVHAEDVENVREQIRKRMAREVESVHYTFKGIKKTGDIFYVEIYGSSSIYNGKPAAAGAILDITERKLAEEEREKLISELQEALSQVKTLSGLLPICASCKKIRDDSGYWNQIESYIKSHSGAEFSHGICPDCAKKLYPQYFKEK